VSLDPGNVPAKWRVNPANGLSRVHKCDRRQVTDDRPHYGEKGSYRQNCLHLLKQISSLKSKNDGIDNGSNGYGSNRAVMYDTGTKVSMKRDGCD